ncbi:MAG: ATP synthase subunit I [Geobacter sp.]|nr:MAG: ATP synthase subunit I [Geobacter sp.]
MNFSAINLLLTVLAGVALGLFYFGGLWLTVRKIAVTARPGFLMFGSFVVRLLVTLCGFYFVMDDSWELLVACLAGFLLMRIVLTRLLGSGSSESHLSA